MLLLLIHRLLLVDDLRLCLHENWLRCGLERDTRLCEHRLLLENLLLLGCLLVDGLRLVHGLHRGSGVHRGRGGLVHRLRRGLVYGLLRSLLILLHGGRSVLLLLLDWLLLVVRLRCILRLLLLRRRVSIRDARCGLLRHGLRRECGLRRLHDGRSDDHLWSGRRGGSGGGGILARLIGDVCVCSRWQP